MRPSILTEMQYEIDRLEHHLARGRAKAAAPGELRHLLKFLHRELFDSRTMLGLRSDKRFHDSFHMLMRRTEMVRNNEQARELLRDVRQFILSLSSALQSSAMEARLHELEGQLKTVAEAPVEESGFPEGEVVTLESLAGKKVLFAIMPFADEFTDVWAGGIKRAASGTGLTPIRIDMITKTSDITDDIVKVIQMAETVVVDVTGNNPNVMFEFGFALALKKSHVVISQSTEYLTFDIKSLRTLIYRNSWQGIETLHRELQTYIRGAKTPKPRKSQKKALSTKPTPSKL